MTSRKPMYFKSLVCACIVLGSSSVLADKVFQWTDESGVTHYSDKQPTGQSVKTLNVRSSKTTAPSKQAKKPDLYEKAKRLQQDRDAQRAAEEQQKDDAEFSQANSQMCTTINENLRKMAESSRVKVMENGEFRYLSPEEISARKSEYQSLRDKHCSTS